MPGKWPDLSKCAIEWIPKLHFCPDRFASILLCSIIGSMSGLGTITTKTSHCIHAAAWNRGNGPCLDPNKRNPPHAPFLTIKVRPLQLEHSNENIRQKPLQILGFLQKWNKTNCQSSIIWPNITRTYALRFEKHSQDRRSHLKRCCAHLYVITLEKTISFLYRIVWERAALS